MMKELVCGNPAEWWRYNLDLQSRSMLQQPCTSAYGYDSCNVMHASGYPSFAVFEEWSISFPSCFSFLFISISHHVSLSISLFVLFPASLPLSHSVSLHFVCVRIFWVGCPLVAVRSSFVHRSFIIHLSSIGIFPLTSHH